MTSRVDIAQWPVFEQDEIDAVQAVLRSGRVNYWTGAHCRAFESDWEAAHLGVRALSMANGSLTMDAAVRALGIGPGDEVIVSPRSYVASAMCVVLAGATPVFADIDPDSGCMTAETAEQVRSGRTRAVLPVHIGGWPCDMHGICDWARRHSIHVIEDCAQAHGGHCGGKPLGTFGIFASWSFCQDKIMTTGGEGGMLCTPDERLWRACWSYSQHGKDHQLANAPADPSAPGRFRWTVLHEGTNLRMTEMQAAIGRAQLRKLPQWLAARRRNSLIMQEALAGIPEIRVPRTPEGHAHYRCTVFTQGDDPGPLRNEVLAECSKGGIPAMHGSCAEIYLERAFADRGHAPGAAGKGPVDPDGRLPNARRLGETSLTFLIHHTIGEAAMRRYANRARECVVSALRRSRTGSVVGGG